MDDRILPLLPYLLPLLLLVLVVRRSLRERRVRLEALWIVPVIFGAITVFTLWRSPPPSMAWTLGLAAAFAVGCGVGWLRGKTTTISIDAETHLLSSRATPIAVILFALVFLARTSLRMAIMQRPGLAGAAQPLAPLITDAFLLFALGMIVAQRIEIGLRCRQLLLDAKSSGLQKSD
ncbi:MAG: hypothetical protein ABIO39_15420 [Caulobacteraceae bacterium]